MPKSSLIDFRAVKTAITMERVLDHYGLLDRFKKSGDSLSAPAPFTKAATDTVPGQRQQNIWKLL